MEQVRNLRRAAGHQNPAQQLDEDGVRHSADGAAGPPMLAVQFLPADVSAMILMSVDGYYNNNR